MSAMNDERFVEVHAANGGTEMVPREWLGHPVLDKGLVLTAAQKLHDEGGPALLVAPTEKSTVAEIEEFAEKAGIDLGDATKKVDKLAGVEAALASMPADPVTPAEPPSDVQLAAGTVVDAQSKPVKDEPAQPPPDVQLAGPVEPSDAGTTPVDPPGAVSEVQLSGPIDDLPIVPAAREAVLKARAEAANTPDPDGTESSDETPANGEEEI